MSRPLPGCLRHLGRRLPTVQSTDDPPEVAERRIFMPFLRLWTVSENEVISETIVSAAMVFSSLYRNLAMDIQKMARNEIRIRPRMESGDVHLAGL